MKTTVEFSLAALEKMLLGVRGDSLCVLKAGASQEAWKGGSWMEWGKLWANPGL